MARIVETGLYSSGNSHLDLEQVNNRIPADKTNIKNAIRLAEPKELHVAVLT